MESSVFSRQFSKAVKKNQKSSRKDAKAQSLAKKNSFVLFTLFAPLRLGARRFCAVGYSLTVLRYPFSVGFTAT